MQNNGSNRCQPERQSAIQICFGLSLFLPSLLLAPALFPVCSAAPPDCRPSPFTTMHANDLPHIIEAWRAVRHVVSTLVSELPVWTETGDTAVVEEKTGVTTWHDTPLPAITISRTHLDTLNKHQLVNVCLDWVLYELCDVQLTRQLPDLERGFQTFLGKRLDGDESGDADTWQPLFHLLTVTSQWHRVATHILRASVAAPTSATGGRRQRDGPLVTAAIGYVTAAIRAHLLIDMPFTPSPTLPAFQRYFNYEFAHGEWLTGQDSSRLGKAVQHLAQLQWLDTLQLAWISPLTQAVTQKCNALAKMYTEREFGNQVEAWIRSQGQMWLRCVLQDDDKLISKLQAMLEQHARDEFCSLRAKEMFDMIVEWPDSVPALLELRDVMATNHSDELTSAFTNTITRALQNRLLHPGANTNDIVSTYISLNRALRLLDPESEMLLLETIAEPVKAYLRRRPDTIHNIVVRLTGSADASEEADLASELENNVDLARRGELPGMELAEDSDVDDEPNEELMWVPDPIHADWNVRKARRANKALTAADASNMPIDIVGILIDIHGGKDTFVAEYRQVLSQRLLRLDAYDAYEMITQLELLKIRFGETSLISSEVMLRDLESSKRINTQVQTELIKKANSQESPPIEMDALLLSSEYWPTHEHAGLKFKLPGVIAQQLDEYATQYAELKKPRGIVWHPAMGRVDVELHMDDGRTLSYVVNPLQSAVIKFFCTKPVWRLSELTEIMECDSEEVRQGLSFWLQRSFLVPTTPQFETEDGDADPAYQFNEAGGTTDETMEALQLHQSSHGQNSVLHLQTYILAALNNNATLSVSRIHNMLKIFEMDDVEYTLSEQELVGILTVMVEAGKLSVTNGMFSKV